MSLLLWREDDPTNPASVLLTAGDWKTALASEERELPLGPIAPGRYTIRMSGRSLEPVAVLPGVETRCPFELVFHDLIVAPPAGR